MVFNQGTLNSCLSLCCREQGGNGIAKLKKMNKRLASTYRSDVLSAVDDKNLDENGKSINTAPPTSHSIKSSLDDISVRKHPHYVSQDYVNKWTLKNVDYDSDELFSFFDELFLEIYYSKEKWLDHIYMCGSRLSGKTHAAVNFMTNVFLAIPNAVVVLVRKTEKQIEKSKYDVNDMLKKKGFEVKSGKNMKGGFVNQIVNKHIPNSSMDNLFVYQTINDEKVKLENGGDVGGSTYADAEWLIVFVEEATQIGEKHIDVYLDTLRGGKRTKMIVIYANNPWSSTNWVVKKFNEYLPPSEAEMEGKGFQITFSPMYQFDGDKDVFLGNALFCRSSVKLNRYVPMEKVNKLKAHKKNSPTSYKIFYLGIDGISDGALYSEGLQAMKSMDYAMFYETNKDAYTNERIQELNEWRIMVGIDWGEGVTGNASPISMHLGLYHSTYGMRVIKERTIWNNYKAEGNRSNLSMTELIDEIINTLKKWSTEIAEKRRYCDNKMWCFIDVASNNQLNNICNNTLGLHGLTFADVEFFPAYKFPIEERVQMANLMLANGLLRFDDNSCPELRRALENSYQIIPKQGLQEGTPFKRNHEVTHWINSGVEYIYGDVYSEQVDPIRFSLYGDEVPYAKAKDYRGKTY